MSRIIAYTRVSSEEQAMGGLGLAAQRDAIRRAAAVLNAEVAEWHSDPGCSGAKPIDKRPGLSAALRSLRPGDVLMVYNLFRLGRDVDISREIDRRVKARRARLHTLGGEVAPDEGDTASAKFRKGIFHLTGAYERDLVIERTRAALSIKRGKGEWLGSAPYGWTVRDATDGRTTKRNTPVRELVPDEAEQEVLGYILTLRQSGMGCRMIARELNASGYKPRAVRQGGKDKCKAGGGTSGVWWPASVKRIIDYQARFNGFEDPGAIMGPGDDPNAAE